MFMRNLSAILLALLIFLPISTGFAGGEERRMRVFFDGEEIFFRVDPQFYNNRLVVPVRPFLEALGARIAWDQVHNAVSAAWDGRTIVLFINRPMIKLDGNVMEVDTPAVVLRGTTMLPLRAVCDLFGLRLKWDAEKGIAEVESRNFVSFRQVQGRDIPALPVAVRKWMELQLPHQVSAVMEFGNNIYILSSLGWKPTGGYAVNIRRIMRDGPVWRVSVEVREPLSGQPTIQVISNPYDLVIVDLAVSGRPSSIVFETVEAAR